MGLIRGEAITCQGAFKEPHSFKIYINSFRTKQSTLYKNVMRKETLLNVDGDFVVYTTNFINP